MFAGKDNPDRCSFLCPGMHRCAFCFLLRCPTSHNLPPQPHTHHYQHSLLTTILGKRWRDTACCEKWRSAVSSGRLNSGCVCHPGDIMTLPWLIRMRYQLQLNHPDDILWYDMSPGWHTALDTSHPDEMLLPLAKQFWWLRVASDVIRMRYNPEISHQDDLLKFCYIIRMT